MGNEGGQGGGKEHVLIRSVVKSYLFGEDVEETAK